MKSNGKSSTPIIAAHTKKNNGQKPAPPSNGNSNGRQARVSRVSSKATDKLKSLILERISDGILAFDSEMNCVYVNERAGEILGREPQTLLGKNFWEEDPQSTGTPFADACQRALEMQTIVPFDGYFPASDTWFEGRVYPSKDGLSVLINKQEKRDDRSEKSEEGILEGSQFPAQNPNPVMRFTHDGKLLYANSAAAPLLKVWKEQTESGIPTKLYDLLQVVVKTGSNTEIELENQGRTYACLLVPIPESGYVNLYFNDITERKLAQESVHALIHQTTTGITRTDLDGKFLFVNQAFCEMLGFSDSELIGKTIWEISHTADLAKNKRLFERILTDEEPYQLEKRLVRRNGSTLWVTVGTSPLRDAAGQICAAVSIIVDITRRKRAEESLLDSARHTLYLSSLSDALRPLSSTSQIEIEATRILGMQLKANRVAYAVIQADGTAGIRNNYVDGVADMTGEFNLSEHMSNEMLMKFRAGRTMITSDAGSIPKNSEPLAVTQEATSLRTQVVIPLIRDGELVATLFVQKLQAHDWKNDEIHLMEETAERMQTAMERARAERDLRESEKRFRILSNTVPSMVWSTTPDGTIQYLNEHWHNYTGLTTEESILHWSELLLHPDDYEQCMAAWNHALKTVPDEYVNEVRYRRYDGEYRWFQSRAIAARDENGNVTAWYGVTTDIHDRMQKQQELQEIINRTPFMLTHGSRDLRYKFVSRAYAEMIGRTPEEVAGKPIIEVVGEQAFNIIAPYIEQVLQGKRVEYEVEIPFERGGTPSLHIVYVPDYDEQGNVVGWFGSITNVTERKRSERAMIKFVRQQTALYHLTDQLHTADTLADIFDSSLQAMLSALQCDRASILLFDASQKIRFVAWHGLSDEYRKATDGHSPWKYGEKNPKPIYYDTIDASDLSDALKAVIAKEGIHSLAFIPLISNGTLIGKFMVYFNTPHTFSESELDLGQTIARQLAAGVDRKRAEESLRVSEEKYRRIVETANEGVWEIDKDTRTLFVNSLMAEMLGYTAEEMIGRSVFEFLLPEDLSEAKRRLEHAKHGGSARAAEFRYRRKDNSVVWLVATNTPKLDEQGNFLGAFAMMSDVTERKQAEEALRQSEERFSRFMEHLPGLAWIKDVEGRYVYANAAAEKAFNTPQDKLYGKTDQEVFPPEIASQFERNDEQALIEGNGIHVMEMLEQQDGILHHSLVTKFPIPGLDGKTILIGGTAFDITERIQMEDALRQARKQAEETADRMARLQEVTASLAGSTIPAQLAELILEQGTRAAGAVTGILVEALTNGQELKTIAALGYPEGTVRTQPLPLSESTPMSDCIRTRRAVWIRSQEDFAAQYPPFAEAGRDIGIQAVVALPLIVGDRTLGGLAFSFAEQHEFLLEERGFFLAVAQQCAQGLERARAEEARRESEERYRAIINQATAGIVRKDANGKLLFVNQAFCDMLGYNQCSL